jgi:hypothetical protein
MACRVIRAVFLVVYLVAAFLLIAGTFGWFGPAREPVSGAFLLVLGVPWSLIPFGFAGEGVKLVVAMLSPAINLAILAWLCRRAEMQQRVVPPDRQ